LPPRPSLRRATHAYKPRAHHRRHKPVAHRKSVAHRGHVRPRHRRAHHARPHHTKAAKHLVLHRLSYPSPLCERRARMINDLIGMPDTGYEVTQAPVIAEAMPEQNGLIDISPIGPGAMTIGTPSPPVIFFPYTPIYPLGPGPVLLPPIGPPGPPPITPTAPTAVPEPGSWALMLIGFGFIGSTQRKRRRHQLQ
jgi:hypothetical protein